MRSKRGPPRASLLLCYLSNIDLADYLHSGRNFIITCTEFPKFFHDTSTLESSQWLDYSLVESASILTRRIPLSNQASVGARASNDWRSMFNHGPNCFLILCARRPRS